ncbi:NUDIX hydrolase [Phenylobacterium immobile]|uniref:NUDIX hydrolase n=1 Tax=Phenylobacterium immobile TaxID=21 RepID=UPI000AF49C36|nr:NUDIX domain-containing protein [Phenylobacterium immobile]
MAELFDVLDESGFRQGPPRSRAEVHADGLVHRAIHVWLFDAEGRVLIQRRGTDVDHMPAYLSPSTGGHVDAGEPSQVAAIRETFEETGLRLAPGQLVFLFSHRNDITVHAGYYDHQFNDVYFAQVDFTLAELVVETGKGEGFFLLEPAEFLRWLEEPTTLIADIFRREFPEVLYFAGPLLSAAA